MAGTVSRAFASAASWFAAFGPTGLMRATYPLSPGNTTAEPAAIVSRVMRTSSDGSTVGFQSRTVGIAGILLWNSSRSISHTIKVWTKYQTIAIERSFLTSCFSAKLIENCTITDYRKMVLPFRHGNWKRIEELIERFHVIGSWRIVVSSASNWNELLGFIGGFK